MNKSYIYSVIQTSKNNKLKMKLIKQTKFKKVQNKKTNKQVK
jgi:hypothetical protein